MALWLKNEDGTLVNVSSDGAIGSDGKDGTKGPDGKDGTKGPDGKDGTKGPDGNVGAKGPDGKAGSKGAKGDTGNPGTNGTDGAKGATGDKGPTGSKGPTGDRGPASTFQGGTVSNDTTFSGEVYTNKWVRCSGQAGVYFQTYGGGWHMSDDMWVRTFGGKGIYERGVLSSPAHSSGGVAAAGMPLEASQNYHGQLMISPDWTWFAKFMSVRRIKDRIAPMSDSVDTGAVIDMLNPVTFIERKNGDGSGTELPAVKKYRENALIWGFVAEEVCDVDAATGSRLGSYKLTEDKKDFQAAGWAEQPMIALIVGEFKQLRSRVVDLEKKVSMLEDRLNELEQGA